jgi:hypothetical protein
MSGVFIKYEKIKGPPCSTCSSDKENHQTKVVELKIYSETAPM